MNQFVILLLAKSTIILALGFVVALLLRSAAASARYAAWTLTFVAVVALPVSMVATPSWRVAIASSRAVEDPPLAADTQKPQPVARTAPAVISPAPAEQIRRASENAMNSVRSSGVGISPVALLFVWLAGALVMVARILAGRHSLRRLAETALPLDDDDWKSIVRTESRRLGLSREIPVCASGNVSTPLAGGLRSPVVILPRDAATWTTEHREVVLRHELAHIARGDAIVCLLSGVACAIYWINPLVWLATRRLRTEQERSCDDRVLSLGTAATDYADHLLQVARTARSIGMHSFVSVAMARPSQLEGRLLAVLQNRRRGSLGRSRRITAALACLIALVIVSAIRPVRTASAIVVAAQADSPALLSPAAPKVFDPVVVTIPEKPRLISKAVGDSVANGDVIVSSGGTLVLDLKTGASLRITGSDENHVRMHATLSGRDWRNTAISLETEGSGARIVSEYRDTGRRITQSSHRIDITVPRRFNIRLKSAGGSVFIRDVEGDFSGSTGGGELNLTDTRGSAHLTTGGGPINVTSSNLSGSVSTGGGAVLIQGVSGGLSGHSGTGAVFYGSDKVTYAEVSGEGIGRTIDGRIVVNKSGGSVNIGDAPGGATISTGGGKVTVGSAGGDVEITTGGGNITIGSAGRGASVSTGAGDVKITIAGAGGYPVVANSGSGTVTLTLPANVSAQLDLETAFTNKHRGQTRIESDWPLSTTVTPDWDASEGTPRRYVRARQVIGRGGAKITVRTVNGDIIIRRR